jgi:predicted RNA-binding protein with PIN domain
LIDARNVVRSRWPNLREDWFVERIRAWIEQEGVRALVVFDGTAPAAEEGPRVSVVGTGSGSADDWIAREAERLDREGYRLWLVTSDRGLRDRVGARAERMIGGGTFAGFLEELARRGDPGGGTGLPRDRTDRR